MGLQKVLADAVRILSDMYHFFIRNESMRDSTLYFRMIRKKFREGICDLRNADVIDKKVKKHLKVWKSSLQCSEVVQ